MKKMKNIIKISNDETSICELLETVDSKILSWDRNDPETFSLSFSEEEYDAMIEGMDNIFSLEIASDFWNDTIDDDEKWDILSNYIRRVLYNLLENSAPADLIQTWFEINMAFNKCYYTR